MLLQDLLDSAHGETSPQIQNKILQEAEERRKAKKVEAAVEAVEGLLVSFQRTLQDQVAELRRVRKMEEKQNKLVKNLDRAVAYFSSTGLPFPFFKATNSRDTASFCRSIGIEVPDDDSPLWKVPADWKEGPAQSE